MSESIAPDSFDAVFSDLPRHCWDLSEIFGNALYLSNCPATRNLEDPADWLRIASGVRSVDLDTAAFDDTFMLCKSADDYFRRKDIVCSVTAKALTRFLYIWSAFETLVDSYWSERQIRKIGGKVKIASSVLKTQIRSHNDFRGYTETLDALHRIVKTENKYDKFLFAINNLKADEVPSAGLTLVYGLRNSFAHGSFKFPEPPDDVDEKTVHGLESIALIDVSSRLALLSIQMLVWSLSPRSLEIEVPRRMRNLDADGTQQPLGLLMQVVHLAAAPADDDEQEPFDFDPHLVPA